jgi:hypothetical protein
MSIPSVSAAADRAGDLTLQSGAIRALLAITFLYPVIICAAFFPTPASDLREHINLGLTLPLYTWNNPPLQTWLTGVIALMGAHDSWPFVLIAQILNFVGLGYLVAIARKFIGPQAVTSLVIIFCGSVYYSLATPTMALNADQIGGPIWAAILYHALSAGRDNRWCDWILCGALFGLAFLTKYYAVVMLSALLAAAYCEPNYRRIFLNDRFHTAIFVSLPIMAINIVPEWLRGDAIGHGAGRFDVLDPSAQGEFWRYFLPNRVAAIGHLARSFLFYGAPALIGLAVLAWRGQVRRPRMPSEPAQRVVVLAALAVVIAMLLLIIIGGLRYLTRYGYPFYGMCLLALLSVIEVAPRGQRAYATITLAIWAALIAGTLAYAQFAINRVLREPAPAAAEALRALWERRYPCGPAYVIGDFRTARGIASYWRHGLHGVAFEEVGHKDWFDPDEVQRRGAIIISTPELAGSDYPHWFADRTTATLALPYRRSVRTEQHTYVYIFAPPQSCSTGFTAADR